MRRGTNGLAHLRLKVGISPSLSGREIMVVNGTNIFARMQIKVGILPSSNGQERIAVHGTNITELKIAAIQKHSSMSLRMYAQGNITSDLCNFIPLASNEWEREKRLSKYQQSGKLSPMCKRKTDPLDGHVYTTKLKID